MSRLARLGVFMVIGFSAATLLWLSWIAGILLNKVVPGWPFVIFGFGIAASLFIVDLLTEEKK